MSATVFARARLEALNSAVREDASSSDTRGLSTQSSLLICTDRRVDEALANIDFSAPALIHTESILCWGLGASGTKATTAVAQIF